tara:strand:- start:335 stop:532 length:198 start_codon:yes stop_codon:yes gene_type:complete
MKTFFKPLELRTLKTDLVRAKENKLSPSEMDLLCRLENCIETFEIVKTRLEAQVEVLKQVINKNK